MRLNQSSQIVTQAWESLSKRYSYVHLESYIVMPNHFHGILEIAELDDRCRGGARPAPTGSIKIKPLGQLMGAFKTVSAKQNNQLRSTPGMPVWQRNYYEHIIRNQSDLESIAGYILANPIHWPEDPEYIHKP
jgi:putative transposase